jgi:hypothetical protein
MDFRGRGNDTVALAWLSLNSHAPATTPNPGARRIT